jgi:tetratricopeptide (TPR) repeat protein
LLERFISLYRDSELNAEARQMLMREYALRGEERLRQGNPQLAMEDFKSAFRVAPTPVTDRIFNQYIFPLPIAMSAFGYRAESVELMRYFEPRFEKDLNRLIQIGFFYIQIEAPLEAARVLERAVEVAPGDHRAHNSLGNAYLIGLRLDEAEREFRRALELNPRDEFANLNLANMLRAKGQHEAAADYYRRQLEINPNDSDAHGGLAISLLALGRDEDAEKQISRAMALGPENYRFLTQLAYYYTSRRRLPLARTLIEGAARIAPRYAWAHITKANIDLAEGKFGDALSTMLLAQNLGNFPTLKFELAKMLVALDGYDQASEVLGSSFAINEAGEFQATLGGALVVRSSRLDLLLERERRAALFLKEQTTPPFQYRLAESLLRINHYMREVARAKAAGSSREAGRPRRTRSRGGNLPGGDASLPGAAELLRAVSDFTELDDGRQPFRMLWVARKMAENNLLPEIAEQLARRCIDLADGATEPEGSMRDMPLLDRAQRRSVFLGRAEGALGWALLKQGDIRGAIDHLTRSVKSYPAIPERKLALWRLGVAYEEAGDQANALELYLAGYDPASPNAQINRSRIEALYKKLHGSLAGLEEKLKQP